MSEAEKIVRSRTKSLRDFHIALISQNDSGGYVAETPVKVARAISATISDSLVAADIA